MSLTLRALTPDEIAKREAALDLAAQLVGFPRPLTIEDVQALYDAFLSQDEYPECLASSAGYAFGEQIQNASDFVWVFVSDEEYGEELCVAAPGKAIYCAPVSMILGRLDRKETVDLVALRDETIETIRRRIAEGKAGYRA